MRNFTYHVPTEVIFGLEASSRAAELVKKYGGERVLVVYGGGSAVKSGLLDRICGQLKDAGIAYETLGGVHPNPRVSFAREAIQKAIAFHADLILAVGGGSVIDTAKAIAHGATNPGRDIWKDIWLNPSSLQKSMPVGVVLTIPAAGSETSDSAVLTDEESGVKRGLTTQLNRPAFAVLDPTLAVTLPAYQLGCGVTDIMMHTLDRYFNAYTDNETSDEFAEALLRVVILNGLSVVKDARDLHAMSEIMWCGSLSHNGITGLGGKKDFAPHQLSQALSGMFDKAHGACLAAVWASWARYVYKSNPDRFARFAKKVWDIDETFSKEEAALAGIAATESYFQALGMPAGLPALIGRQDEATLDALARLCSFQGTRTVGSFQVLDEQDMRAIFAAANERL